MATWSRRIVAVSHFNLDGLREEGSVTFWVGRASGVFR